MSSRLKAPSSSRLIRPTSSGLVHPSTNVQTSSSSGTQRKPPQPKEAVDSESSISFECGDRVLIGGVKQGTIAFLGPTQFARGVWAGVILDTAEGKNNGSVNGISYFQCKPNCGLFAKPEKLVLIQQSSISMSAHRTPMAKPLLSVLSPLSQEGEDYRIGDQVLIDGKKPGMVAFVGPTQFAKGIWIGITLDTPEGKNDGSVAGIQYFECPSNHGVFTRAAKLTLMQRQDTNISPLNKKQSSQNEYVVPRPQLSAEELKAKAEQLHPGDRIIVNGNKEGTLRYIGITHFAKGMWVGVELDIPHGKNDGAVSGKRYFQCDPLHGLFAPLPKVEKVGVNDKEDQYSMFSPHTTHTGYAGRKVSGSSVSSVSSLSSLGRMKQIHPRPVIDTELPRGPSPTTPVARMSGNNLSHIMFEKDHQIATLQSSLDQSEQDKMKLSEQVTDLQRQVDDLNFRLEELSVISGDQLEKVTSKDDGELKLLKQELFEEKEKNGVMKEELHSTKQQIQIYSTEEDSDHVYKLMEELNNKVIQIQELEKDNELLKNEIEKAKHELQSAESDFKSTELAARNLQSDLDTIRQQLQETLDLCAQQEALLEDKFKELENVDEQSRNLQRDIDRMTSERQQLVYVQEQLSSERDQALKQCESLMKTSATVSTEQTELATQKIELLQERDQARAELRDTTILLEQISGERDDLQQKLSELLEQKQEAQGCSEDFSSKLDVTENELENAQLEVERLRRESHILSEHLENRKLLNEQKVELAEATCSELRERLDHANEERDSALQQAQRLSDKLEKKLKEVDNLGESLTKAQNFIQELQYQLEEVTKSHDALAQESVIESSVVQQELEVVEERLELRERELQDAKEKIVSLEEEMVIKSSTVHNDQRFTDIEEENHHLEEQVQQLTQLLEQVQQQNPGGGVDESNTAWQEQKIFLEMAIGDKDQEISFLKSVIADQQTKIETLEALNGLGDNAAALGYLDSSEDDIGGQLPPPRLFCDICDEFDQHDTGDCPLQAQVDSPLHSMHQGHRAYERPYCENCEIFGHWTDECDYEDTY